MSSDTIFSIFVASAFIGITFISVFAGIKEGKDSFKKLTQHLDEKEKDTKKVDNREHEMQYH